MPETSKPSRCSPPGMRPQKVDAVPLERIMEVIAASGGRAAPLGSGSAGSGSGSTAVTGVCIDSRQVEPGDLYIGLPGALAHGARFAEQAVAAGAAAVLTDAQGASLMGDCAVPVLVSSRLRAVVGPLSALIYQSQPAGAARPALFGITGTNGKTTTTYLLNSLLRALDHTTGLIGTIEILAGSTAIASELTTPESPQVHGLLAVMRERGLSAASMEVSSHAIAYHRVDGVYFDVAGFTNLTQDHLDLHTSMEEYFTVKLALFSRERANRAVITVDDKWGRRMAQEAGIPVTTLASEPAAAADWTIAAVESAQLGYRFELRHRHGQVLRCSTGLPGEFNVANAALAALMVHESGVSAARLQQALDLDPFTVQVPGRMQLVGRSPVSIVDFAHNPDALLRALDSVRPAQPGARLLLVFGATGQRDAGKRTTMGAVAAEGADVVIITDDDPHDEEPADIRASLFEGAAAARSAGAQAAELHNVAPRAAAIDLAVEMATAEDTILVAGRGHEIWQEIKGVNHPLDDRVELREALERHGFASIADEKLRF